MKNQKTHLHYIFDFDSTLVSIESLDVLIGKALSDRTDKHAVLRRIAPITEKGMTGLLPFEESIRQRCAMSKIHTSHVTSLQQEIVSHTSPSIIAARDFFRTYAHDIFIVSGGFEELIFPVATWLGISHDHVFANRFVYDSEGFVQDIDWTRKTSRSGGKADVVRSLTLPGVIFVLGDGVTDCDIVRAGAADYFIVYTEHVRRESMIALAHAEMPSFDPGIFEQVRTLNTP